ncbi:MAG: nucleotide exchange factor GrpE [Bacteroidota bacterium]
MEDKEIVEELAQEGIENTQEQQGEEVQTAAEEPAVTLSAEEQLQLENEELKMQVGELKDKFLRLRAEFDNFRRRTMKERLDLMKTASRDTMSVLLPILDDFDRAKSTEGGFSEGVTIVHNKMMNVLEQKGLKAMDTTGEVFDPELHEALTEIPAASEEMKGKIVDTIEKGYYLNDKIIRHAKVVVGK